MANFIPEEEIRKDIEIIKEAPDIKVKREIGKKYGCPQNQCSKWTNVYLYILEYLREIRKTKSSFTENDIHDFYTLTNYVGKYEKLKSYLMMETGSFIKYILDNEYQFLLRKGIKQYTLDNIDKITINNDITHGSMQLKFWLDRYKSIKKYYDENHGTKTEMAKQQNKISTDLYIELVELTYDMRMELEQHLENFILDCYDIYKYGSSEYVKIHNLLTKYRKILTEKNPYYDSKHTPDEEEIKLINYCNSLHLLLRAYQYFNEEENEWGHRNRVSREDRIENSIQYFNKIFEKTLNGIVKRLQGIDLSDIEISQELNATDFGYYFLIKYGSKNLYVNFILQHENQDYEDIEKFSKNKQHISFLNNLVVAYEMKVTSKPLKLNQINESLEFDFNSLYETANNGIKLALDDYQDIEDNNSISHYNDVIDSEDVIKQKIELDKYIIDLGLPSGTLWCRYNLGHNFDLLLQYNNKQKQSTPEDWYGDYYEWNWKWEVNDLNDLYYQYEIPPFLSNKYKFQIPSSDQLWELYHNTTIEWIKNYKNIIGLNGMELTSIKNGNKIFIPASGSIKYYDDGHIKEWFPEQIGKEGYLWSSSTDQEDQSQIIYLIIQNQFYNKYIPSINIYSIANHYAKYPIRLVAQKQ